MLRNSAIIYTIEQISIITESNVFISIGLLKKHINEDKKDRRTKDFDSRKTVNKLIWWIIFNSGSLKKMLLIIYLK
jgi:hypothetical protein